MGSKPQDPATQADDEVEQESAVPLRDREAMSIIDPSGGGSVLPLTPSVPPPLMGPGSGDPGGS